MPRLSRPTLLLATALLAGLGLTAAALHPPRPLPTPTPLSRAAFRHFFNTTTVDQLRAMPRLEFAWADPNNYGDRLPHDWQGVALRKAPLIVLHETNYSADSALDFFRQPDLPDEQQASYHSIIRHDGTVVFVVPAERKAYGAADSRFRSARGEEAIAGHPDEPPSVNSFAYHISLETPWDGQDWDPTHSGYTPAQYRSLAWLIARTPVPRSRITTHAAVDRSGERMDPRSFDWSRLDRELAQWRSPEKSR